MDKLPSHSYTILPPPPPPWHPNSEIILPPLNNLQFTPSLLHQFIPLQPNFYLILPPLDNLPPHFYTFHTPWKPNFYIFLTPLNKLPPHPYTNLSPLAAQH